MMPRTANFMLLIILFICSIAAIGTNSNNNRKHNNNNNITRSSYAAYNRSSRSSINSQDQNAAHNVSISALIETGKDALTTTANAANAATFALLRERRGANSNFQLDQSELARQNQITQQIFANYLERRLFPNRSTNQKIPTIEDILPKPVTTTVRPRPRGFKRGASINGNSRAQRKRKNARMRSNTKKKKQLAEDEPTDDDEDNDDVDLVVPKLPAEDEDFDIDGQESLQSVESEQHDHYYANLFQRDPSENEIDSDCPNCVDETQYANKWTMPLLKLGEKRYYLGIFFKANWFKAAQYCRYHGMHLASISSQEENDRLEKYIRDFGLGHEHFWISGTDLADEGNFFWMANGRPITFTNWNAGEPNNFRYENGEEENCLELWNRDGKGLKWNDSPCSFETYFVCEIQPN